MKRFSYFVLLFLSLNDVLFTKSLESNNLKTVKIIRCYDGDTCTTSEGEKIRLACIDAPEIKDNRVNLEQALLARDYLNSKVKGKSVILKPITTDRYNRTVGELYTENINIQELLYKKGLAKIYKKYAYQCLWTKKYI